MRVKLLLLSFLIFFSCSKVIHLANISSASVKIEDGSAIEPDAEIAKMISGYSEELDKEMNQVIGNGAKDLTISEADLTERVAQVYFGKGLMTPFKGVLSDAEIVAVSQYLETLRD